MTGTPLGIDGLFGGKDLLAFPTRGCGFWTPGSCDWAAGVGLGSAEGGPLTPATSALLPRGGGGLSICWQVFKTSQAEGRSYLVWTLVSISAV